MPGMERAERGVSSLSSFIHDERLAEEKRERWEDLGRKTAVYWKRGVGVRGVNSVDAVLVGGSSRRCLSPSFSKVRRRISLGDFSVRLISVFVVWKTSTLIETS